jgi:TPP-dependent pyruvate/acetoin dehydrogenase alpha subunit
VITIRTICGPNEGKEEYNRQEVIRETDGAVLKKIYTNMVRTRMFDEEIEKTIRVRGVSILQHSTLGQEATPNAVIAALEEKDYVMPYHRGWGWGIAKGMDPGAMLAELIGRKTGVAQGKAGAQLSDIKNRVMGRQGIQGAHLSITAGVALGLKQRNQQEIVVAFFGDGASNSGNFYEGINLASVWHAPAIYVNENNGYSITQRQDQVMNIENIADRAVAFGIPGFIVDGNDAIAVYKLASTLVEKARNGEGPFLVEAKTYRLMGHTAFEQWHYGGYRSKEEVDYWRENKDPVAILAADLLENGLMTTKEIENIQNTAKREMEAATEFALNSPYPTKEELLDPNNMYA